MNRATVIEKLTEVKRTIERLLGHLHSQRARMNLPLMGIPPRLLASRQGRKANRAMRYRNPQGRPEDGESFASGRTG